MPSNVKHFWGGFYMGHSCNAFGFNNDSSGRVFKHMLCLVEFTSNTHTHNNLDFYKSFTAVFLSFKKYTCIYIY